MHLVLIEYAERIEADYKFRTQPFLTLNEREQILPLMPTHYLLSRENTRFNQDARL